MQRKKSGSQVCKLADSVFVNYRDTAIYIVYFQDRDRNSFEKGRDSLEFTENIGYTEPEGNFFYIFFIFYYCFSQFILILKLIDSFGEYVATSLNF